MATILEDDFNSYNDGDLVPQSDWVDGDWTEQVPNVQGVVVKEGAKAVEIVGTGVVQLYRVGALRNDGKITVYIRRNVNTGNDVFYFALCEGVWTTQRIIIRFHGGNIEYNNGAWQTIQAYVADHWYQIEIEWRSSDHKARYRIDGGDWTDWDAVFSAWTNGLDIVRVQTINAEAGDTGYWDHIAEEPIPAGRSHGYIF